MNIFTIIISFIATLFTQPTSLLPTQTPTPIPTIIQSTPTPTVALLPTITNTPLPLPTKKPLPTATKSPLPTVKSDPCTSYEKSAPSTSVKVVIKSKSNYNNSLKLIELKSNGCPIVKGGATDKEIKNIFKDNGEVSFGNLYPGPYKVQVKYGTSQTATEWQSINTSSGQTSTLTIELP